MRTAPSGARRSVPVPQRFRTDCFEIDADIGDNAQLSDLNPAVDLSVGRDPLSTTGNTNVVPPVQGCVWLAKLASPRLAVSLYRSQNGGGSIPSARK